LINQNGKTITQNEYQHKIYVVDFFFTRCPSICPVMTDNMVHYFPKILKASIDQMQSDEKTFWRVLTSVFLVLPSINPLSKL